MNKIKAFAKINLFLKVYPKGPKETKHKIYSLFCLLPDIYDVVQILSAKKLKITFVEKHRHPKENIHTQKCIERFAATIHRDLKLHIKIHKYIPRQAGLGGSGASIAAVINWVIKKYKISLTKSQLLDIALNIGSDIPFFLSKHKAAIVKQYGNDVKKVCVPCQFNVVLTNVPVCSKQIYHALEQSKSYKSKVNIKNIYTQILKGRISNEEYNDLWPFVAKEKPQLKLVYNELKRQNNVVLSGSGGSFVKIWRNQKK